jgi:3-dehydrotetronate 4-kinase
MTVFLGCIADDFTGATDLANNLVRSGMRVVQTIGIPNDLSAANLPENVDCIVVALKSRTIPVGEAIAQSLAALHWLQAQGATQFYFKICSTFDSTAQGNIGQVTEALMAALHTDFVVATPAFPENGRTVFKGHLFVGDQLLSESGMRNHPLTPMTDSNLVRVLQAQSIGKVGLIEHRIVEQGEAAIRTQIQQLRRDGFNLAIADAVSNADLLKLDQALSDAKLMTAGSGLAIGLAKNFGIEASSAAAQLPPPSGYQAIISGSCSVATNAQVSAFVRAGHSAYALNPLRLLAGDDVVSEALQWALPRLGKEAILIYSSEPAESVKAVQAQFGAMQAGSRIEKALANITHALVAGGVGQLVVAGGETSGACVQALEIQQMRIGMQIAPGVPWCYAHSPAAKPNGLHLTLKSGNFGDENFFTNAFQVLNASNASK